MILPAVLDSGGDAAGGESSGSREGESRNNYTMLGPEPYCRAEHFQVCMNSCMCEPVTEAYSLDVEIALLSVWTRGVSIQVLPKAFLEKRERQQKKERNKERRKKGRRRESHNYSRGCQWCGLEFATAGGGPGLSLFKSWLAFYLI